MDCRTGPPGLESNPGILKKVYKLGLCAAGILKQSMGARNRVEIGCRTGPPGYIIWWAGTKLGS
jgi:hypothetical protein